MLVTIPLLPKSLKGRAAVTVANDLYAIMLNSKRSWKEIYEQLLRSYVDNSGDTNVTQYPFHMWIEGVNKAFSLKDITDAMDLLKLAVDVSASDITLDTSKQADMTLLTWMSMGRYAGTRKICAAPKVLSSTEYTRESNEDRIVKVDIPAGLVLPSIHNLQV